MARLEQVVPEPVLYPSERVREAELWGDLELQDLGRQLSWGRCTSAPRRWAHSGVEARWTGRAPILRSPMCARPGSTITSPLSGWKNDLAGLPEKLARVEEFAASQTIGGEQPNAADLQIGATLGVLPNIGDLRPLLAGGEGERIARRYLPDYPGDVPAGAFPVGWVPERLNAPPAG